MGPFVYAILGTSKDITLGPTAIMSLLTAAFATSPVENDPTYALLLTFFCGVVQLLLGVLHLGMKEAKCIFLEPLFYLVG